MGFNSGFKGLNKSIQSIKCITSTPHENYSHKEMNALIKFGQYVLPFSQNLLSFLLLPKENPKRVKVVEL